VPEEIDAAVEAVAAALEHPLLGRARQAWHRGECRREVPATLCETDGTVIDGIVDLAFVEGGGWTVVDFKTDRELSAAVDVYKRQIDLYCRAIAAATGQSARGILLRV
jgi:ATP-dependent exoDNAse (exonuclease V) beta subunit